MECAGNLERGGLATMVCPVSRLSGSAQLAAAGLVSHGIGQKNAAPTQMSEAWERRHIQRSLDSLRTMAT